MILSLYVLDIKNNACCYFDYIMKVIILTLEIFYLARKIFENVLIYGISYKTFMGSIPLHIIRFDEIDGFINIYDGIRYLVLVGGGFYDEIFDQNSQINSHNNLK